MRIRFFVFFYCVSYLLVIFSSSVLAIDEPPPPERYKLYKAKHLLIAKQCADQVFVGKVVHKTRKRFSGDKRIVTLRVITAIKGTQRNKIIKFNHRTAKIIRCKGIADVYSPYDNADLQHDTRDLVGHTYLVYAKSGYVLRKRMLKSKKPTESLSIKSEMKLMMWESPANIYKFKVPGLKFSKIHQVLILSDLNHLKKLIKNGVNVNTLDSVALTPLHYAIESKDYKAALFLLKHGGTSRATSANEMESGLQEAIGAMGYYKSSKNLVMFHLGKSIVSYILSNSKGVKNKDVYGKHVVYYLVNVDNVQLLKIALDVGFSFPPKNKREKTPLMEAKSLEMVRFLVKQGADVNAKSGEWSVLCHHSRFEKPKIVEALLKYGASIKKEDRDHSSFHTLVARRSAKSYAEKKYLIKLMLQYGAKVNSKKPRTGFTPLHSVAYNSGWREAEVRQHLQTIQILLELGANPRLKSVDGKMAYEYAHSEAIKALLKKGRP